METIKNPQITIDEIRQSEAWARCLKMYGWEYVKTSSGINIAFLKTRFGAFVKIQKPKVFNAKELKEMEEICKKNKALFIKIEPSLGQDLELLDKSGYVTSPFLLTPTITIYIDLKKTGEELWNDISHSGKYSIHRAQREGAIVEYCRNPSEEKLREFYKMHEETARKKKFSLKGYADIKKRAEVFGDESFLILVYGKDKNLCSGKFYLGHGGNIWYMYGGTTELGRHNKTGYELLWQSILYFKKLGYGWLDLEGIYDPRFPKYLNAWGGFSHFKEKFGGVVVEFPVPYVKYLSPVLKVIAKLYGGRLSL